MQSFKRGMPLLPALDVEHCCCEIDLGATKGLRRWRRWEPEPVGSRFRLGPYLRRAPARYPCRLHSERSDPVRS